MKFVIQRVNHAEVKVDGEIVGKRFSCSDRRWP